MPHNHHDRGTLHAGCRECEVLTLMMRDAGVDPSLVHDYRREPHVALHRMDPAAPNPNVIVAPSPGVTAADAMRGFRAMTEKLSRRAKPFTVHEWSADDRPDLDIEGAEMGNKAVVTEVEGDEVEREWLSELLLRSTTAGMPYGAATQAAHAYLEHGHFMIPLGLSLGQVQEVHASLHHMGIGHIDNADHLVYEFPTEKLKARHRLLKQAHWSALSKGLKAEQHRRREQGARASREAVMVESARSLKRAIDHTKGTVLLRANMDAVGARTVQLQVGRKDRVTIAAATIGNTTVVGTAICHPGDRFDAEVGRQLAMARALIALGSVHELEWMDLVARRNA